MQEEGEMDYDDQMASEDGESEMSDAPAQARQPESTAAEEEEQDDDIVDEDGLTTNLEHKRDQAIRTLLAKEDLGIIQMRIKETIRVLSNYKELCQPGKNRGEYVESLKQDISASYDYNMDILELIFDLFSP
jgi:ribosomal RNA methyltransferase Nop2